MAQMLPWQSSSSCMLPKHVMLSGKLTGQVLVPEFATMAHMVIGGTWSAGVSGWSYQHLEMAEIYVCMVEDKALWMGRNIGSAHVHFDADGYVEAS